MEHTTELARVMKRIELAYQAAQRALTSPAIVAPHDFIQKRMEEIEVGREKLAALVGDEVTATDLLVKRLAEIEEQEQKHESCS